MIAVAPIRAGLVLTGSPATGAGHVADVVAADDAALVDVDANVADVFKAVETPAFEPGD